MAAKAHHSRHRKNSHPISSSRDQATRSTKAHRNPATTSRDSRTKKVATQNHRHNSAIPTRNTHRRFRTNTGILTRTRLTRRTPSPHSQKVATQKARLNSSVQSARLQSLNRQPLHPSVVILSAAKDPGISSEPLTQFGPYGSLNSPRFVVSENPVFRQV